MIKVSNLKYSIPDDNFQSQRNSLHLYIRLFKYIHIHKHARQTVPRIIQLTSINPQPKDPPTVPILLYSTAKESKLES